MKKTITIAALIIFVWGCAKKVSPTNSSTAATTTAAPPVTPVDYNTGAGTQPPVENSGTYGTKSAAKERTAEENAQIAGQATYNAKCGRCHGLKVTTDYTAERWASILAVMAPKANLTEIEREHVYAYVKANAKK